MQRRLVVDYRRLVSAYRSHIQGSSIGCPETSVANYQYKLRNIPEERKSHLGRGGSLRSHKVQNTASHYTVQGIMDGSEK